MVQNALENLVNYGIEKQMIAEVDKIYVVNIMMGILQISEYTPPVKMEVLPLEKTLNILLDDAIARGVIEDSIVFRDLLDTKLMGVMTPFPREVRNQFDELYRKSPQAATDWYYDFSCNTDYIRRYRIAKDRKWKTKSKYGTLDVTINLSKPEKDPKAIAAAKNAPKHSYPLCMLCKENEGASGGVTMPARQNHRIIPIVIDNKDWFFQYSPYVYYNEHCIVFNGEHTPMKIERSTFAKMMDFIKIFPHYFVGSNADLPIVGGSILSHDHFQGGHYTFAMETAETFQNYIVSAFPEVKVEIVNWAMSVVRITHKDSDVLVEFADKMLQFWQQYSDEEAFIFSHSGDEPHNTITPIARKKGDQFQLDLVLRNNITTEEHPMGLYHPHVELHHIKKENIGLIEVMGLAVLPSRLKEEMEILADLMVVGGDISANEQTAKHADWVRDFLPKYKDVTKDNVNQILEEEIGLVFENVLEHAGVFRLEEPYFDRFMTAFGGEKQ